MEGLYLLHQIFQTSPDNPPPVIYCDSETSNNGLAFFEGYVFNVPNYFQFEASLAYKTMAADGPIWHIYDSTVPSNVTGSQFYGPQIVISSPGASLLSDMKQSRIIIYLPLPSIQEMKLIR